MGIFDADFSDSGLPRFLTPVRLRGAKMLAWLKVLCTPITYLYNLFKANRTENLYVLAHTGQVCYLEAVLNDLFDNVDREIFISDGRYVDPEYVYRVDEEKPLFIDLVSEIGTSVIDDPDPVPLYTLAETWPDGIQFIIHVPAALGLDAGQLLRLRALVDKYRLPSKNTYTIVTF